MKKFVLFVLLTQAMFLGAQKPKPNPADYPLTVHVVGSHGGSGATYQHLEVIIDGKYMELQGVGYSNVRIGVLALGDYKAKVTKGVNPPSKPNGYDLFEAYELLFSDGVTRYYEVIGLGATGSDSAPAAANP